MILRDKYNWINQFKDGIVFGTRDIEQRSDSECVSMVLLSNQQSVYSILH